MQSYETRLVDSSRMIADIMVADIGNDQEKFDEMMVLALRDVYPLSMRAARIIELCMPKHINLFKPHIDKIIRLLPSVKVDGLKRNFLKIFADSPIYMDEELSGQLVDLAFNYLGDQKQAISVRAYAIDILVRFVRIYPEMKPELIAILESMYTDASVGLRLKSRKIIRLLSVGQ
jgi:hypothetical protein